MIEVPKSLFDKCSKIAVHAERAKFAMNITQQKLNWHWSFQLNKNVISKRTASFRNKQLDDASDFLLRLLDEMINSELNSGIEGGQIWCKEACDLLMEKV